ncbi:MAG: hypothetical protein WCT27_01355 [Patescibacteria group bacterium]|jgi:predicted secreted protein
MKRSKKVVFACHCLLNQNARAQSVAKCPGLVKEFVDYCHARDYGIIALDCPQLRFEPVNRPPATREHYEGKTARLACRKVINDVIRLTKMYRQAGFKVCGIFGVEGSPTCGAKRTHVLSKAGKSVSVRGDGVFFKELKKALKKNKIKLPIFDWDIQAKKLITN